MEEEDEVSPSQEIDFCTLGMLIIGERGLLSCVDFHPESSLKSSLFGDEYCCS
jgi:hypothetical protein